MKQRKNYPKTASAFGIVAGALFVMGFLNFVFFFPAGFLVLIALILAIGPDRDYNQDSFGKHKVFSKYGYKDSSAANCLYGEH